MRIITETQNNQEWYEARLGMITSSRIGDLMTNARKKDDLLSQTAKSYMLELIAEILTGEYVELHSKALQWGADHESIAIEEYETKELIKVKKCGLIGHSDLSMYAGTPDGIKDDKGIIEVKCPYNSKNHIDYLINGMNDKGYHYQVQSNILLTDSDYCDFISFDPRIKDNNRLYIQRIEKDEEVCKSIIDKVKIFQDEIVNILNKMENKG